MGNVIEPGASVDEKQSKIFWASQEIAIVDAVVDANGNGTFAIRNSTDQPIDVTSISVDGTLHSIPGDYRHEVQTGETHNYYAMDLRPCIGLSKSYNLYINYIGVSTELAKRTNEAYLVVTCGDSEASGMGSVWSLNGQEYPNITPISDGLGNWVPSGNNESGIVLPLGENKMCFGGIMIGIIVM